MDAEPNAQQRLNELLSSERIQKLIDDVKVAYNANRVSFELTNDLDSAHGAFVPDSQEPLIEINTVSGLNEANLAHELVHALQIRNGYPTTKKGLFADKRQLVIRELNSNILHIPLVDILLERGFDPMECIEPTLSTIERVLSARARNDPLRTLAIRVQFDAATYIRLKYEATNLTRSRRRAFERLFQDKAPNAVAVGSEMITLIDNCNVRTPVGNTMALYKCVKLINEENLGRDVLDFEPGLYEPCLYRLKKDYPFLT